MDRNQATAIGKYGFNLNEWNQVRNALHDISFRQRGACIIHYFFNRFT